MAESGSPLGVQSSPGAALLEPDVEARVSRLSDFELVQQLASNEGVTSWLALWKGALGFSKWVLLKVADAPVSAAVDVALRLTDEAKLGMALSHPHLVRTLDLGRDGDRYFLVREWVEGRGLRRLLLETWSRGQAIPPPAVLRIGICVCRALGYLHHASVPGIGREGIVHRAVSPSNVLISAAGEVRLANLAMAAGIAKELATAPPLPPGRDGRVPAFRAPELMAGRPADARTDVYGLGCVLFEALMGPEAFDGAPDSDWSRFRDDARVARALREAPIPEDLAPVLARAMAPEPERRYDSAAALRDDLRLLLREQYRGDGDAELRALLASAESPLATSAPRSRPQPPPPPAAKR